MRILLLAALLLGPGAATAGDTPAGTAFQLTRVPDTPLLDQRGQPVRLWSDLVQGQLVAINFIFTSCRSICPPMGAAFAQLQHRAADRGLNVRFLSVSIDPTTDTPAALSRWAGQFGGTDAWTLLTGEPTAVDGLLNDLGVRTAVRDQHAPVILLGNAATGAWWRGHGLSDPAELEARLVALQAGKAP